MGHSIGIDLGTTNSCVAYVGAQGVEVIPNRDGYKVTPSVVAFGDGGNRVVGEKAKRQALTNPLRTQ